MPLIHVLTAGYAAGVAASNALEPPLWIGGFALFLSTGLASFLGYKRRFVPAFWASLACAAACMAFFNCRLEARRMAAPEWSGVFSQDGDEDALAVVRCSALNERLVRNGRTQVLCKTISIEKPGRAPMAPAGRILLTGSPERKDFPDPGETVRAEGFLRDLRPFQREKRSWGRLNRVPASLFVPDYLAVEKTDDRNDRPLQYAASLVRRKMTRTANAALDGRSAGLLLAMTIGDKSGLSEDLERAFQRVGLTHVLVVSGMHLSALFGFFGAFRFHAGRARWIVLPGAAALAVFFVAVTGSQPSALRALWMLMVLLFTFWTRREYNAKISLSFAALMLLLANPNYLFNIGAQLSFLAVAGILWLYGPIAGLVPARWRTLSAPLIFSLAAQAPLFPVLGLYFNQFSVLSAPVGCLLVPLLAVIMPLGALGLAAGLAAPALFVPAAILLKPLLALVETSVLRLGGLSWASFHIATPDLLFFAAWFAGLAAFRSFLLALKNLDDRKITTAILAGGLCANFLIWRGVLSGPPEGLEVSFLDVGQGDSTLLRGPDGWAALVDGGGAPAFAGGHFDPGEERVARALRAKGLGRIDYLFLTHPDEDHLNGLLYIARNFEIGRFLDSGVSNNEPNYAELMNVLREKGVKRVLLRRGWRAALEPGLLAECLSPGEGELAAATRSINDASLVLKFTYGKTRVLLPGDIEAWTENRLAAPEENGPPEKRLDLKTDLLKIPHHASKTSSARTFLDAAAPREAVYSCGRFNRFGHPDPGVLLRYKERGIPVDGTARSGAVEYILYPLGMRKKTSFSARLASRTKPFRARRPQ